MKHSKRNIEKILFQEKTNIDFSLVGCEQSLVTSTGSTLSLTKKRIYISFIALSLILVLVFGITYAILSSFTYTPVFDIDKYVADFSGAENLALLNNKNSLSKVGDGDQKVLDTSLVKMDKDGNYSEVTFSYGEKSNITLDDLGIIIFKMHTDSRFTYISYCDSRTVNSVVLDSKIDKTDYEYKVMSFAQPEENVVQSPYRMWIDTGGLYFNRYSGDGGFIKPYQDSHLRVYDRSNGVPAGYDYLYYINTELIRSYIIDNATGMAYSTESIGEFNIIDDGIIKTSTNSMNFYDNLGTNSMSDGQYLMLDIVDNNLHVKNIVANDHIKVESVAVAADGTKFVVNNQLENYIDTETNTVYTTNKNKYLIDSNNRVYLTEKASYSSVYYVSYNKPIKIMEGVQEKELDINAQGISGLAPISYAIREREIYRKTDGRMKSVDGVYDKSVISVVDGKQLIALDDGTFIVDNHNNVYHLNNVYIDMNFTMIEKYDPTTRSMSAYKFDSARLGNNAYDFPLDGGAKLTNVDKGNVGWLEYGVVYSKPGYTIMTPTGTKRYSVSIVDNEVIASLASDKLFEKGILIIKPIKRL